MVAMTRVPRRTKIVCTVGPATASPAMLDLLVEAGMDAARLNFSHGTHAEHAEGTRLVREAQQRSGRPLALIADLQGPKLRVGELPAPIEIDAGDQIWVAPEGAAGVGELPISPPVLGEVLEAGHELLIDDGAVRLRVEEAIGSRHRCRVVVGGIVSSHKGVNLPGIPLPIPSLTEKDLRDLDFALGLDVDFIACRSCARQTTSVSCASA